MLHSMHPLNNDEMTLIGKLQMRLDCRLSNHGSVGTMATIELSILPPGLEALPPVRDTVIERTANPRLIVVVVVFVDHDNVGFNGLALHAHQTGRYYLPLTDNIHERPRESCYLSMCDIDIRICPSTTSDHWRYIITQRSARVTPEVSPRP